MPYTTPTHNEFKERFPRFLTVSKAIVDDAIEEAERVVDSSWLESDYQKAIMFLAAHYLTMEGHPNESRAVDTPGGITSEKLGDASVTYGSATGTKEGQSDYNQTQYGRRFQELLQRNVGGVLVP